MVGVVKTEKWADDNLQIEGGADEDVVREANRPIEKLTRCFETKSCINRIRQQETVWGKGRVREKTWQQGELEWKIIQEESRINVKENCLSKLGNLPYQKPFLKPIKGKVKTKIQRLHLKTKSQRKLTQSTELRQLRRFWLINPKHIHLIEKLTSRLNSNRLKFNLI